MNTEQNARTKVVFFDGVCGFCNSSVDFLMRIDRGEILSFSPLQGEFAKKKLPPQRLEDLDTIVYLDGDELLYRTTALIRITSDIGGIWSILYPLLILPETCRDWAYKLFAKNRYRLFGKKDSCRMPTPEERARFLD